jgi:hypothetical protein
MLIWRWLLKPIDMILSNPMRALALIVLVLAAINYKTLLKSLPSSVPEIDNWLADIAPLNVTMTGEILGVDACWRMIFTFFEEDGTKLLATVSHSVIVSTLKPEVQLALPHRHAYLLRLQTEVYFSDPETCLPIGAAAILKSRAIETALRGLPYETHLHNACDFTEENRCDLQIR